MKSDSDEHKIESQTGRQVRFTAPPKTGKRIFGERRNSETGSSNQHVVLIARPRRARKSTPRRSTEYEIMNEYTFAKTCIKVAGLIILILGLTGVAINSLTATIFSLQYSRSVQKLSDDRMISALAGLTQASRTTASRIPGNIIQIVVGLYLCRKYHKPLKWLMKDEPTISRT